MCNTKGAQVSSQSYGRATTLFGFSKEEREQELGRDSGGGVKDDILPASGAGGQESLVPFIEAGDQESPEHCEACPTKGPLARFRRQGFSPGTDQEKTQQGVPDDVTGLTQNVMPGFEMGLVYAEQEMKNRVQDVAGVLAGEVRRRFNGDNNQPQDSCDPSLKKVLPVGVQES